MEFKLVKLEGRELRLSRLQKELWPGITKADLIKYYLEISDFILPYLRGRPLTLNLYPDGISGKNIIMKSCPSHAPAWVKRFPYYSEHERRTIDYVVCEDKPTLVWLANLANVEFHITLSRHDDFEHPDLMVFDLDPFAPASFEDAREVALVIRDGLRHLGLEGYPKTSGATGLHVLVGIERKHGFEQTREVVRQLGSLLERLDPRVLSELKPVAERKGKVLVDFAQNSLGKTITAPYSLKPLAGAPVSTPLSWAELERGGFKPQDFNIHTIFERLKRFGDLMLPILNNPQDLSEATRTLLK